MRYSFTCAAFAALAATVLAAPVLDKRDRDTVFAVDIVTVTTTVTVTVSPDSSNDPYYGGDRGHYHKPTPTVTVQPPYTSPYKSSSTPPYSSSSSSSTSSRPSTPVAIPSSSSTSPTSSPPATTPPVTTPPPAPTTASATTSEAPVASPAGGSFEAEVLAAHNAARALHSASPLTYNSTLAAFAQTVSGSCVFKHSGGPYGENLAAGYPTTTDSINAWVGEGAQYDYANPGFSETTGHFTQVVWVGSTQVGCYSNPCNGNNGTPGDFLTCEYYPPGNFIGEFKQNVLPS